MSSYFSAAHGDLHSRNILVDRNGFFNLVDSGSICELPWPGDIARLSVDLISSCLDAGADSHEWGRLYDWLGFLRLFIEGSEYKGGEGQVNLGVHSCLEWIRRNLPRMHPEVFSTQSEYEFRLAVAVELLRSSYRSRDLPSPKRVWGVLGFCVALQSAIAYFEKNLKRA